jgi:DNA polymerase-3 subunit epsilon
VNSTCRTPTTLLPPDRSDAEPSQWQSLPVHPQHHHTVYDLSVLSRSRLVTGVPGQLGILYDVNDLSGPSTQPACHHCGRMLAAGSDGTCESCRFSLATRKASKAVASLLDRDDVLVLDTETTGLKGAEVIELSMINTRGEVLLDTLIKPKRRYISPFAQQVHHITLGMLDSQPTWPEVLPEFERLTKRATVLAWNASFDRRMIEQTSGAWGVQHPRVLFVCAMHLYSQCRQCKRTSLQKAVDLEGLAHLKALHTAHRALGDVTFTLNVLRTLSGSASPE